MLLKVRKMPTVSCSGPFLGIRVDKMTTISCSGLVLSCASGPLELLFGLPPSRPRKRPQKPLFSYSKRAFWEACSNPEFPCPRQRPVLKCQDSKNANSLVPRAIFSLGSCKNANSVVLRARFGDLEWQNYNSIVLRACFEL